MDALTSYLFLLQQFPFGIYLNHFALEMQMMLYGAIFGCLSPILSISAFLSHKSPFVYPKDEVSLLILH